MILLILVYASAKKNGERIPEYSVYLPRPVLYFMILIFAAAAAYTLFIK
jgi:hypothetical protein